MVLRITIIWILGALLIVPYSIYRLLYEAQPEEYAFLIVAPLFWIFGFWGVVGPAIAAYRVYGLMKALDQVQNRQDLQTAYEKHEGREAIVDLIASENHIPRFLARMICGRLEKRLKEGSSGDNIHRPEGSG